MSGSFCGACSTKTKWKSSSPPSRFSKQQRICYVFSVWSPTSRREAIVHLSPRSRLLHALFSRHLLCRWLSHGCLNNFCFVYNLFIRASCIIKTKSHNHISCNFTYHSFGFSESFLWISNAREPCWILNRTSKQQNNTVRNSMFSIMLSCKKTN